MEDLKIYTIDELHEMKKGRGPDKQKRKSKGMKTSGGREWQVSGSGVKEEKAPEGYKWPKMPEYKTSWASKSLGDCYTIDELYELKKGRGPDLTPRKKRQPSLAAQQANVREGRGYGNRTEEENLREGRGEKSLEKGKVYDPAAVAAMVGRKKYGEKKFAEMSAAGRKRKKAPKGKAKMAPGGGGRFAKLESEISEKNKGKK